MAVKNSSVNLDITNNADGFDITGGSTRRKIKIDGGNIELQGNATGSTFTFPSSSATLAGLEIAQIFAATQKIDAASTTAFVVEDTGVKNNVFVVDTVNGTITIPVSASDPTGTTEGQMYYNSGTNTIMVYDGATWGQLTGGGGGTKSWIMFEIGMFVGVTT